MENSRISTRIRFLFTFLIIAIGWHLLYEGIVKILDPYWSADSFLAEASGPFAGLFHKMASNPGLLRVIDVINIAGLTAIGLMLMLGLFTRYAAIAGALLLSMYYLANPSWVASRIGFGVEGNYMVVNKNLIEVVMLVLIASIPPNWYYGIHHLLFKKSGRRNLDSNTIEQGNADTGRRQLIKNLTFLPFMGGFVFSVLRNLKNHPDAVSSATAVWDSSKIEGLTKLNHPPNEPMGIAQGIFPGRVVWVHNPDATNRQCTNTSTMNGLLDENDDAWFMDKNTRQDLVDNMLTDGVMSVSGKEDLPGAWQKVFETHNQKRGKGITGYREGEKIYLKLNRTSASWDPNLVRHDHAASLLSETSPQIVLSVLRQLTGEAGVKQEDIYVGDAMRGIFQDEYEKYFYEFPNVRYLSKNNQEGRTKLGISEKNLLFYSDKKKVMPIGGSDKLYSILEEADYLICLPAMKAHNRSGITLFAKNHFGSIGRRSAGHLHPGLNENPERMKYGVYRVLVDIMKNRHTGDKNLIYFLDALWAGPDWNQKPVRFYMPPFNRHWTSSIFTSLDPVAIESVAFDFLRSEFMSPANFRGHVDRPGTDDYLHQAADHNNWPEGFSYEPNGDGIINTESLGVHEHWNNKKDKQYSRNLKTGEGIELVKIMQGNNMML